MGDDLGDRHSGTAGGALGSLEAARPIAVHVTLGPTAATSAAGQRAAWLLINLLARAQGGVTAVTVTCPRTWLLPGVAPAAAPGTPLAEALLDGALQVHGVPVSAAPAPPVGALAVGIGGDVPGDLVLSYGPWWGGIAPGDRPADIRETDLPFGPYLAAAHAAGHIFRSSRPTGTEPAALQPFVYDAWSHRTLPEPPDHDPTLPLLTGLDAALAGVGAVGNSFLLTLWATPELTGRVLPADGDTVDGTNLNRCVLFWHADIDQPKATTAGERLRAHTLNDLSWDDYDGLLQGHPRLPRPPAILISAVDRNTARHALQRLCAPSLLAASTYNLRATLLRAGPPGIGACLACHNPPEHVTGDADLRHAYLAADERQRTQIAKKACVSLAELDDWAHQARCGELDARALPLLAAELDDAPREFAVGYLSALAGILLAAETVKEAGLACSPLSDSPNHVSIQTVAPWNPRNSATRFGPQPDCAFCSSTDAGTRVWQRRHRPRRDTDT